MVFVAINENHQDIGYGSASMKQDLVSDMLYGQEDEVYVGTEYRRQKVVKNLVNDLVNWFNQQDDSILPEYEHRPILKEVQAVAGLDFSMNGLLVDSEESKYSFVYFTK
ncbi:hypothetical protein [Bacillus sp. 166amftsu]|uniref:hypothetical protein n=1 Tax=Bacillus sp. 166amftsu TaxID=1761753 RepID=UPI00089D532E|nr:hypothetical protein [Bacillus sp. 166amftsu]SDY72247.1 hypothetical protein SAMN04488156_10257 [Bacillus sp. 166amftsu]